MRPIPAPYDDAGSRTEESLLVLLAAAARRRSDGVLAVWAGAGCVFGVVFGTMLPRWRVTFLLAVCAAAFGLWGIADRELGDVLERDTGGARRARMLRIVRATIAVLGIAAGVLALFVAFGAALGTWIS